MSALNNDFETAWTPEERSYWLAFDQLSGTGLGVQKVRLLYEHYKSLKYAWIASRSELKQFKQLSDETIDSFIERRSLIEPQALLHKLEEQKLRFYPLYHPLYPACLRAIHDPPLILYMKGRLTPDDMLHNVAIVGTRRSTPYGQRIAKDFARGLARSGATIISGMAVGIDSLAHWGAIESGGKTVAVLGSGVDVCYPSSNRRLYNSLVEGDHGAVVSELFPGTKPEQWHFPARNRIISGLCQALLVVEADESSGALITARLAFEQSREVFAIPGRIDQPMSAGTNSYIARNMAQLTTKYEDIVRGMNWATTHTAERAPTVVELYGREREVFELISLEPVHFDSLCGKSGMSAPEMSAVLTMLELAGVVERLPGDWYIQEGSIVLPK